VWGVGARMGEGHKGEGGVERNSEGVGKALHKASCLCCAVPCVHVQVMSGDPHVAMKTVLLGLSVMRAPACVCCASSVLCAGHVW
jgi:hypothetical protein